MKWHLRNAKQFQHSLMHLSPRRHPSGGHLGADHLEIPFPAYAFAGFRRHAESIVSEVPLRFRTTELCHVDARADVSSERSVRIRRTPAITAGAYPTTRTVPPYTRTRSPRRRCLGGDRPTWRSGASVRVSHARRERQCPGRLRVPAYIKDNRLLPRGFDKARAVPNIAGQGAAQQDPDFTGDHRPRALHPERRRTDRSLCARMTTGPVLLPAEQPVTPAPLSDR